MKYTRKLCSQWYKALVCTMNPLMQRSLKLLEQGRYPILKTFFFGKYVKE